ncbi:MAG: Trm112 family protein [Nitrospirae bacterium]|nr:Trm112 family protein [Nitrospirota bacterium]
MLLSGELLDILACPKCKGDLTLTERGDGLTCGTCMLMYSIEGGVPVMLIDDAIPTKAS